MSRRKIFKITILLIPLMGLIAVLYQYFSLYESFGIDWMMHLKPSSLALFSLKSPYQFGTYNPPWAYVFMFPIALLPDQMGAAVMFALGVLGYAYAAHRFGARPWQILLMVLNPYVLLNALNGNIDFLVVLGITLPPQIGLFFVLLKPQISIGIVLFWAVEEFRTGGIRAVFKTFAPVGIAFLASFLIYGPWLSGGADLYSVTWNGSLWPTSIPVGLALLAVSLRKASIGPAISASPFLSPYLSIHGWAVALFGMIRDPYVFFAAWAGIWIAGFLGK